MSTTAPQPLELNSYLKLVREGVRCLQDACYEAAYDSGWWVDPKTNEDLTRAPRIVEQKLCLIHSEISEALEGHRKGLKDDHLPHLSMLEVELADAMIRIGDLAGALDLDLGQAVAEKLAYNSQREDHKLENRRKEGGKLF